MNESMPKIYITVQMSYRTDSRYYTIIGARSAKTTPRPGSGRDTPPHLISPHDN